MKTTLKRLTLMLICAASLSGCATKLAYHYLDFALLWYFEGYVKLDRDQKRFVKEKLDEFHYWHRTSQLPRYALYLEGLKIRLASGKLTGEQLHKEVDELQIMLDDSLAYLLPIMIDVAATFSDAQVAELLENVAKEREDYRKEFVDVTEEELHKARIAELKSHLKLSISRFNKAQENIMQTWSEQLVPFEALTLKQQEVWGEELKVILEKREDREQLDKGLRKLFFVHTDHWDPELEKIFDTNQAISYQAVADIINSLDSKQRKKMNAKLDGYVEDFRELAVALNRTKN